MCSILTVPYYYWNSQLPEITVRPMSKWEASVLYLKNIKNETKQIKNNI